MSGRRFRRTAGVLRRDVEHRWDAVMAS